MKKLNITKEAFEKSKHFQRKYGKLEYVSESGKLFKTNKGHVIKFVKESEGVEPNSLKMKLVKKAKQATEQAMDILDQAAEEVKNAAGETFLYARLDYHARDLDKTIDDLSAILNKDPDAEASVNESNDDSGWFDDRGWLLKPIPGACVVDCSGSGKKDDEVDHWMRELGFDIGLPVAKAVQFLKEFGAWDDLDLLAEVASTGDIRKMRQWIADNGNDMDDRAHFDAAQMAKRVLAQRILWEFCNEIREQAYDTSEEDLESVGLSGYIGDWNE